MDTRFIIPIYEDEDYNDALEYLVDRMKSTSSGIRVILEQDEGMVNPTLDKPPKQLLHHFFRKIISSCYGVNMPLMANYFRIEDEWNNKYKKHLINYLKHKYFVEIVDMDINAFALNSLRLRNSDPGYYALSKWNPDHKWTDMDYTDSVDTNIMNPINHCLNSIIYIISKSGEMHIDSKFTSLLNHMNFKYSYVAKGNNFGISINVLPCKTPVSLLKLVQLIHKYL